jgi:hypothetical protein
VREELTHPIERETLVGMLAVEREPTTRIIPQLRLHELLADTAPAPEVTLVQDAATSWLGLCVGAAIFAGVIVMLAMFVV